MIYNLSSFELCSYFYTNQYNENVSSMDYNNEKLVTSTGRRHFISNEEDSENDEFKESIYRVWNIKELNI